MGRLVSVVITKEVSAANVDFLLLFLLRLFLRSSIAASSGSSGRLHLGELLGRHVQELIPLGGEVKLDLSLGGDGDHAAHSISERMGERRHRGETSLEGDGTNAADSRKELGLEVILGNVENGGVEQGSIVVDGEEHETVREGLEVELLEKRGLGAANLFALFDELEVRDDLDLSAGNLGGHIKSLEPGRLAGVAAGGSSGDDDGALGNDACLRGGGDTVFVNNVAHVVEASIGEDEAGVAPHVGKERLAGVASLFLGVVVDDLRMGCSCP